MRPRDLVSSPRRFLVGSVLVVVGAGVLTMLATRLATGLSGPPPAAGTDTPASGVYGPAISADSKANIVVGGPDHAKVAYRFRATDASALTAVAFAQRGGPTGYSKGDGGRIRLSIQADGGDGPSGVPLASLDFAPGNPAGDWDRYDYHRFASPPFLVPGALYEVVLENPAPDDVNNFISANEIYDFGGHRVPRQAAFSDDFAVLATSAGRWSVQDGYTAVVDIAYADGGHDGNAYYEAMRAYAGTISGSSQAGEELTVSGPDRLVREVHVRVLRLGGDGPLQVTLETGDGSVLAQAAVAATSIALGQLPDESTGTWIAVELPEPQVLVSGRRYRLRLSTDAETTYAVVPIREQADQSEPGWGSYAFRDGSAVGTTDGRRWRPLYGGSPVDLQLYFR